jgi:hypothetical protein
MLFSDPVWFYNCEQKKDNLDVLEQLYYKLNLAFCIPTDECLSRSSIYQSIFASKWTAANPVETSGLEVSHS